MKFSSERINSLKLLLKELGLEFNNEQAHEAGLAIMRFALVKKQRELIINKTIGVEYGES